MKAITRTAAGVTAAAIAVTTSIAAVNADNDKYTKPYTIANVLTDYQFFVEGDFSHGGHTVGAVAVGGSAKIGAFGDGQVAPSYIHHIESVGNFSDCTWVDEANKAHNVYYGESDIGERTNFVKNDDFIDFTEAMSRIRKESQWIADNGTKIGEDCYDVSSSTITVDLKANNSKNYTIDYSLFSKARTLNFTGLTVEEFAKGGYTLSVVGVNGNAGIDFTSWGSMGTHISLNGQGMDGKLKDISGASNGGQYNPAGTPLLYNFPDATSLDINYLAGGLCAPNATVSLNGDNYEGNIIAKSVAQTNAEAHFFSYYPITEQGDTKYPAIDGDDPANTSSSTTTTTTTTASSSAPVSSNTTTTSNSGTTTTTTTTTTTSATPKPDSGTSVSSKSNTTTTTTTSATTTTSKSGTTTTTSKSSTTTTTSKSTTTTTSKSSTTTTTTTTSSASASKPVSSDTTTTTSNTTSTSAAGGSDATGTSNSSDTTTTTAGGEISTVTSGDPVVTSSTGESSSVSSQTGVSTGGTDGTTVSTTTKKTSGSSGTSTTTKKTSSSGANTAKAVDAASASNPKTGAAATTAAAVLLAAASVIAASKKNKD